MSPLALRPPEPARPILEPFRRRAADLEHFPHKWDPVVRKKMRNNKDLERQS
jgi:hypothetical protein